MVEVNETVAEGVGFEPTIPVSQDKRLAGARTRPLCDPSTKRITNIADWANCNNKPQPTAQGLSIFQDVPSPLMGEG